MDLKEFKAKLGRYKKEEIIVTYHAELQAFTRDVDIEEVKENLINPEKLVYVEEQESKKYNCYFAYSKHLCHRYILVLNRNLLIVTIIKINRDWQKAIG